LLKSCYQKVLTEAGCDEAGRGCFAGPVFAAAVILPVRFKHPLLNDSKQLSEKHRDELREVIEAKAIAWAVASIDNFRIDEVNILNASFEAMHAAVDALKSIPEMLLIDGNRFKPYRNLPHACIIKGDGIYASIAAASILAKTHRDEYMQRLHQEYPQYNWQQNKGYGTREHRSAIEMHGINCYHRRSFRLTEVQTSLFD